MVKDSRTFGGITFLVSYGARFYVNGNVQVIWGFNHICDAWAWITQHAFLALGETANVVKGTDDSYSIVSLTPGEGCA